MSENKVPMAYDDYFNKAFHSDEVWTKEDNDKFNDLLCDRDNELVHEKFLINEEMESDSGGYSEGAYERWSERNNEHMNNVLNFYDDVSRYRCASWQTVKMAPDVEEFGVTQDTISFIDDTGAFGKHFEEYVERRGDVSPLVSDAYKDFEEVMTKKPVRKIPSEFQDVTEKAEQMSFFEGEEYDI